MTDRYDFVNFDSSVLLFMINIYFLLSWLSCYFCSNFYKQQTVEIKHQPGPGREFDDFTLRIASSIGELLLLLYKSGFYRRE